MMLFIWLIGHSNDKQQKHNNMARAKKQVTLKEPVRIRFKELSNGTQSIYLDIYKDGKRSYEFLKLYLLPEISPRIKEQNAATLAAANTIKSKRIIELTNNEAGLKNTSLRSIPLSKGFDNGIYPNFLVIQNHLLQSLDNAQIMDLKFG